MTATRRPSGFSLVELLIVIAVIATLATLVLPTLRKAVSLTRMAACQHNLHSAGVAIRMYLNESDDIMPVAAQMPSLALTDEPGIAEALAEWLDHPRVLRCPADYVVDYYQREGSSYEYHSLLGGRPVDESFLSEQWGEGRTPVMNDYEPFHGPAGRKGSTNFLFADSHVGDLE